MRNLICWITGHDVSQGNDDNYEPPFCLRCGSEYPMDDQCLMNKIYHWLVEQEYDWFDRFDVWLCDNPSRIPDWWEY